MEASHSPRLLSQANVLFVSDHRIATLPQPKRCGPEDSFCPLLALASHLNYHMQLPLPLLEGSQLQQKINAGGFRMGPDGLPDFIEVWSDMLFSTMSQGHTTEYRGTIYYALPVENSFMDGLELRSDGLLFEEHEYQTKEEALQFINAIVGKP